jgi:hypothetical protein
MLDFSFSKCGGMYLITGQSLVESNMKGDIPRLPLHNRVSNCLDQNAY